MRTLMLLLVVAVVAPFSGCGSGDSCEGVDTSQAPTSIYRSNTSVTYYWGDCSRTYLIDSYNK